MSAERQKIRAAEWLYRWNLSMSILGIVFTILTFVGVFTLVLHQYFAEFGLDEAEVLLVLLAVVLVIIFGFGFYLDKFLRFWSAQTTVATVRNQFLTSALYQKELLIMKYSQVPQMEGLLHLVEALPDSPGKAQLVDHFRDSLRKLRQTIESKEWQVAPEEPTYCDMSALRGGRLAEDFPILNLEGAMGDVRDAGVVRHDDDRLAEPLVKPTEQ